jgi:hypothetical protein
MPIFATRKKNKAAVYSRKKNNRTGEDIDMLHENETDPQSGSAGSYAYKDHEDGA